MNGRVYDPQLGLFLSPDPYVQMAGFTQNFNRYGYCLGNPLLYTDPSGELNLVDDLIVAGVGFAVGYVSHGVTSGDWGWDAVAVGASHSRNNGGFGVGYYQTYYGNAKGLDGVSNRQVVGGLTVSAGNFSFRMENDFLAWRGQDRWRSNGVELGFFGGDLVVGTTLYNNDPKNESYSGEKVDKAIESSIWGKNRGRFGGWKNGLTYASPLYVGYRHGHNITRVGYSHKSVQDFTQNGVHKWGFLGSGIGRQNYYANYSRFITGAYFYQGHYNSYSLWGK